MNLRPIAHPQPENGNDPARRPLSQLAAGVIVALMITAAALGALTGHAITHTTNPPSTRPSLAQHQAGLANRDADPDQPPVPCWTAYPDTNVQTMQYLSPTKRCIQVLPLTKPAHPQPANQLESV
jgi:hypothetical protein